MGIFSFFSRGKQNAIEKALDVLNKKLKTVFVYQVVFSGIEELKSIPLTKKTDFDDGYSARVRRYSKLVDDWQQEIIGEHGIAVKNGAIKRMPLLELNRCFKDFISVVTDYLVSQGILKEKKAYGGVSKAAEDTYIKIFKEINLSNKKKDEIKEQEAEEKKRKGEEQDKQKNEEKEPEVSNKELERIEKELAQEELELIEVEEAEAEREAEQKEEAKTQQKIEKQQDIKKEEKKVFADQNKNEPTKETESPKKIITQIDDSIFLMNTLEEDSSLSTSIADRPDIVINSQERDEDMEREELLRQNEWRRYLDQSERDLEGFNFLFSQAYEPNAMRDVIVDNTPQGKTDTPDFQPNGDIYNRDPTGNDLKEKFNETMREITGEDLREKHAQAVEEMKQILAQEREAERQLEEQNMDPTELNFRRQIESDFHIMADDNNALFNDSIVNEAPPVQEDAPEISPPTYHNN